jgi:hypothetical protein
LEGSSFNGTKEILCRKRSVLFWSDVQIFPNENPLGMDFGISGASIYCRNNFWYGTTHFISKLE